MTRQLQIFKEEKDKLFQPKDVDQESEWKKLKKEWERDIIPKWMEMRRTAQLSNLCFSGIPPTMRSKLWSMAIPNRLSITQNYFNVCLAKSRKLAEYLQQKKN